MEKGENSLFLSFLKNVMSNVNSISLIDTYMVKSTHLTDLHLPLITT
jgi:hypothetical protein